MDEITNEWLEVFEKSKADGEVLADSIFWRLALYNLPEGVDPDNPKVKEAVAEIRKSCEDTGRVVP